MHRSPEIARITADRLDERLGTVQIVRAGGERPARRAYRVLLVLAFRKAQHISPRRRAALARAAYESQGLRPLAWRSN